MRQPEREDAGSVDPVEVCTRQCGARCCRYVTVTVPTPRSHADWDEFRWWLAHGGTMLTHGDDGWMLHVETRCAHLGPANLCRIYAHRMTACADYDFATCEFQVDVPFDVELRTEADLADHLERRGLKRGAEVRDAIRAAERARSEGDPA